MAVTAEGLRTALGLADDATGAATAERLLPLAQARVDAYLNGSDRAPEAVRDEAVIRVAGRIMDRGVYAGGTFRAGDTHIPMHGSAKRIMCASGAADLLNPYVKRTA